MDDGLPLPYTLAGQSLWEDCMTKAISIALIAGGIVLLYFGGQAFNSVSSDVARVFTGSPSNKAIMLIVAGVVATLAGLTGVAMSGRKR
jgi:uncharacterized membrane protein YidH (DUF202 family)